MAPNPKAINVVDPWKKILEDNLQYELSLEEFISMQPELYNSFLNKADGKHIVVYHRWCNDDTERFIVNKVLFATRRGKEIRIIEEDSSPNSILGSHYVVDLNNNTAKFGGFLSKIERAVAASPGTEFRGWKNTLQYRFTDEETSEMIKGKVFTEND